MAVSNALFRDFAMHVSPRKGAAQADSGHRCWKRSAPGTGDVRFAGADIRASDPGGHRLPEMHTGLSTRRSRTDQFVALASVRAFFPADWTAGEMRIAPVRSVLEWAFGQIMHFLAELLIAVAKLVLLRRLCRQRLGSPAR